MRTVLIVAAAGAFILSACPPPEDPLPVDACGGKCDAATQVCLQGTCKDKVCEPFKQLCKDAHTLQYCNGNGTELIDEPCTERQACVADSCVQAVCTPGEYFCQSGERRRCNDDSISSAADPCQTDYGCSGDGECVPQICEPGTIVDCVTEGERPINRCDLSGTATYADQCQPAERCVGDLCQPVICEMGKKFCADTTHIDDCAAFGTAGVSPTACHLSTASVCVPDETLGATCITACDAAAQNKSYIGCNYWFANTDNAANQLDDQNHSQTCTKPGDVDFFPSAVVIANTSTSDAHITLYHYTAASPAIVHLPAQQHVEELPMPTGFGACATAHSPPNSATVDSKILVGSTVATILNDQDVDNLVVPPGGTAQLLIPSMYIDGTRKVRDAYNLVSDLPVSAYFFNPVCCNFSYSVDASLLIPSTAWRTGYFAISSPHLGGSGGLFQDKGRPAGLSVVANEDSTQVAIRLRPGQNANQFDIANGVPAFSGNELRLTMNKGEVLQLETKFATPRADVTGVLVAGDKPIGVFGFHECEYVPQDMAACDHVEEMLPPIETWGDEYVAAMPKMRNINTSDSNNNERMFYKFVSAGTNNVVTLSPKPADVADAHDDTTTTCSIGSNGSFVLGEAQYCEFGSRDNFHIQGTQPLMVGVLFSGQDSTNPNANDRAGDPSLSLLVPVDQYRRDYSFLVPDTYYADFVTVVFNPNSTIKLDGTDINPSAGGAIGSTGSELVGPAAAVTGSAFSVMHVKLSRGAHTMKSVSVANPQREGERFGVFNYGYDMYVSYGYPGGMDLVQSFTYPNLPGF